MYQKNQLIELEITDLNQDGEGVGRTDAFIWFIKDTVPGDRIEASVMKVKKTYGYARLTRIITPSRDRVKPACPVARSCGGCSLQAMSYEAQLRFKENKVRNNLMRIGGCSEDSLHMEPIIGMEEPLRYRNKAIVPFGRDKGGKVRYGFFAGHSHDIVPCQDCLIGPAENRDILEVVKKYYDDSIRNVLIKKGFRTGQIMVCIVRSDDGESGRKAVARIARELDVTTVVENINEADTNVVLGDKERIVKGPGYIEDYIGALRFRISARSFFQVNPVQVERLYGKALEYADIKGGETVWDLYCGIGTISLSLAAAAADGQVYGVEIVEPAIRDAEVNASINGITNVHFSVGKAEEFDPTGDGASPDVIVVDPPRKGCDINCLNTIIQKAPRRLVYVSCDSATLARDIRILCDNGYELKKVCPVDMFPQTGHVECVAEIQRINR